jgi:hypothetical protein
MKETLSMDCLILFSTDEYKRLISELIDVASAHLKNKIRVRILLATKDPKGLGDL